MCIYQFSSISDIRFFIQNLIKLQYTYLSALHFHLYSSSTHDLANSKQNGPVTVAQHLEEHAPYSVYIMMRFFTALACLTHAVGVVKGEASDDLLGATYKPTTDVDSM